MKIAIIGCGYVASFYAMNAKYYNDVEIAGAYDTKADILTKFCNYYAIKPYPSSESLMNDASVEMVLNLTNPRSHFECTKACLLAGKHVYTEKPVAMSLDDAQTLIDLARSRKLRLGCAPCSVLSNTAQTLRKAIQDGEIGNVKLIYANYTNGMIAPHNVAPWQWTSKHGAHWPAKDEFEIGCTYEHAGYFLTWLNLFFGPALTVTAFSSCLIPEKGIAVDSMAPDFSVGCIEYKNGVVARVAASLAAPRDRSFTIVGDKGQLVIENLRNDNGPIYIKTKRPSKNIRRIKNSAMRRFYKNRFLKKLLPPPSELAFYEKYPLLGEDSGNHATSNKRVDFMLGVYDMIMAIRKNVPHKLTGEFGLHILEQMEVLQYSEKFNFHKQIQSTFSPGNEWE